MTTHPALTALAVLAFLVALAALGLAVVAYRGVRQIRLLPNRRPVDELRADDDRRLNLGAPRVTGERRQDDRGPAARHRAPDDARQTRREAYGLREGHDEEYPPRPTPQRRDEEPATVEQAPPTADMRTLPPPGSIRQDR